MGNNSITWGQYGFIDLGECNSFKLRDEATIKRYIEELIVNIKMKQFGEVLAVRFALHDPKVAGYSAFCFLETSSITAHFAEDSDSIYIDIFTCSELDMDLALKFSCDYFDAKYERHGKTIRMIPNKYNSNVLE